MGEDCLEFLRWHLVALGGGVDVQREDCSDVSLYVIGLISGPDVEPGRVARLS